MPQIFTPSKNKAGEQPSGSAEAPSAPAGYFMPSTDPDGPRESSGRAHLLATLLGCIFTTAIVLAVQISRADSGSQVLGTQLGQQGVDASAPESRFPTLPGAGSQKKADVPDVSSPVATTAASPGENTTTSTAPSKTAAKPPAAGKDAAPTPAAAAAAPSPSPSGPTARAPAPAAPAASPPIASTTENSDNKYFFSWWGGAYNHGSTEVNPTPGGLIFYVSGGFTDPHNAIFYGYMKNTTSKSIFFPKGLNITFYVYKDGQFLKTLELILDSKKSLAPGEEITYQQGLTKTSPIPGYGRYVVEGKTTFQDS